jgi:hypothetical protein
MTEDNKLYVVSSFVEYSHPDVLCVVSTQKRAEELVDKLVELEEYNSLFHKQLTEANPYKKKGDLDPHIQFQRQYVKEHYQPPKHLQEVLQWNTSCADDFFRYVSSNVKYDAVPIYDYPVFG